MHLFTSKARKKIYAHGIRCENKGITKYISSAVRRKYPKSKKDTENIKPISTCNKKSKAKAVECMEV